jgi:hypothetical protein
MRFIWEYVSRPSTATRIGSRVFMSVSSVLYAMWCMGCDAGAVAILEREWPLDDVSVIFDSAEGRRHALERR